MKPKVAALVAKARRSSSRPERWPPNTTRLCTPPSTQENVGDYDSTPFPPEDARKLIEWAGAFIDAAEALLAKEP
jgi:hypothetical protein